MHPTQPDAPAKSSWHAHVWRGTLRVADTGRDLFEQFIWGDIRDGMLDLNPLPRPLRLLVYFGLALAILLILLITQSGWIRATFALQPSLLLVPGRGVLVPIILYPLGLFLFGLAWAFALTGAAFSAASIRVGILALYLLTVAAWVSSLPVSAPGFAWLGLVLVLATTAIVLAGGRLRRRPLRLFALLLLTTGGLFAAIHAPMVAQDRASGLPLGTANLENNVRALSVLAMPLLILVGLDIADFAQHAAEWTAQAITSLLSGPFLNLVAWGAFAWLIQSALAGWLDAPAVNRTLPSLLGVSLFVLLLLAAWLLLAYIKRAALPLTTTQLVNAGGRLAVPFVILYLTPALLSFVGLDLALILQIFAIEAEGWQQLTVESDLLNVFIQMADFFYEAVLIFTALVNMFTDVWLQWLMVGMLLITPFALRRGHTGVAFIMVTVAVHYLWVDLTRAGSPLGSLMWDDTNYLALAWAVILIGTLTVRAWRNKRLSRMAPRMLLIVLILAMLRNTSFIEDPFSPFFAFAGLGFLAFGLGWDLLTSGRWANTSTPRLPQPARIFLYIGYMLVTVILVNWSVHSHDLDQLNRFTGDAALFGFFLLGRPYLFLLLFGLATDIVRIEPSAAPDSEPAAPPADVNVSMPAESAPSTDENKQKAREEPI